MYATTIQPSLAQVNLMQQSCGNQIVASMNVLVLLFCTATLSDLVQDFLFSGFLVNILTF